MILAVLEIQNYKQYVGEHRIELPASGIVGVIGANGVGKTTLFEAIEWCLYNPSTIANAEVPPRAGVGQTRVRVVLEEPNDGTRYVVERSLKRGVASGEIYREDRPDAPIVQGSRQVTDYVARQLIGLSHRAFVSTFFTRQKELSFFGNLKETDRRREVGRLLGLETIREAQRLIGDDRTQARAEAGSLALQFAEHSAGRDFPAERATVEGTIAEQERAAEMAAARFVAAREAYTMARADLGRWRELQRRDAALGQELARVGGDDQAARARLQAAEAALRRLDEAAASRAALLPVAATETERATALLTLDALRERHLRRQRLDEDVSRAEQTYGNVGGELKKVVADEGEGARAITGWTWTAADAANPIAGAERLAGVVAALDVEDVCERASELAVCRRLVEDRLEAKATLDKYRAVLDDLRAQRGALLNGGDPDVTIARARKERQATQREEETARATAEAVAASRRKVEQTVHLLRTAAAKEACPTCGRPLGEAEAAFVILTLEEGIAAQREDEAEQGRKQAQAQTEAAAAERAETAALALSRKVIGIDGRIAQGLPMEREAAEKHERIAEECTEFLARVGLDADPTPESVAQAQARADLLQRLDRTLPLLRRLGDDARRASDEADQARQRLAALGPVDYDPAAHDAARNALIEAQKAAAQIVQLDAEMARRPGHETDRATAVADLERLAADITRIEADRAALAFDPAALAHATTAEETALDAERAAGQAQSAAQTALRDAVQARDDLLAEQARVAALAERAEARGREADELERMYREFTHFDQYVAGRVTPQMADQTGELLGAITEGKYDRVEFDENYGLTIFDDDERFPVDAFSGGERDVAALAARLALSRLVGGQAAHPPSFLVLDEVFGSLDQDRRAQVLATLGLLTASTNAFRQLFIISHVEDVRLSSIFDEVWRISEVDGVSRFENLTRGSGIEEL